jgi:hypothetical protein
MNLLLPKLILSNSLFDFKKAISLNFTNYLTLANVCFGWVCSVAVQVHTKEGGWDTGVGRSSSI